MTKETLHSNNTQPANTPITALILAGGKSSRFGSDKAHLQYKNQGIINHLVAESAKVCNEIIIISDTGNKFSLPQVQEIADIHPGNGPMGGLHAGLQAAKNSTCLLMACDMPLVNAQLMQIFIDHATQGEIILPRNGNEIEPMFGIYKKSLLPAVEQLLNQGRRSLLNLTKLAPTVYLDKEIWQQGNEGQEVFFNINYQEDYQNLIAGTPQQNQKRKNFYKDFLKQT